IKFFALLGFFYYFTTSSFSHYLFKKFDYYNWSQAKTIKKNGRFTSFIYYGIISRESKKKLILFKNKDININKILFNNLTIENKRNIYVVILESFIDPRLIKDVTFNRSPLSQNIEKYLGGSEFFYIKSPVYGGGTSQSEFEIFTAIPALSKVSSIEFNTLEGNQISGFVNALKHNGYKSKADIATYSGYYNSKDAYKSIGFDEAVFLEESNDFEIRVGDKKIFDGDLYDYNLRTLKKQNLKTPYLHYALGMYGHFPYDRNLEFRPDIITTTHKDKRIHRIANQFYYRTKALANHIDNILSADPSSIIFVASDHLPPLLTNGIKYTRSQTDNIGLLLIDGKTININGLRYYDIPRLIWKLLKNNNEELTKINAKVYEEIYFKALSESLQ
ncbi:MAG: sulfatase-like hydrolase/transferase, partial [Bacteroidales bacterium]|nr:sulfatase-like hydrolase/transferase [Bacteroidales bacterium]